MKKKYDFSNAQKGKFYRPIENLEIPIYLDKKVKEYFVKVAEGNKTDINKVINSVLKKEIEIQKLMYAGK